MRGLSSIARATRAAAISSRRFGQVRFASSAFKMPAMSPTMTEGGIADWKKQEGESFTAGDVLLEIETDKATIDVEAQDDGILAKIVSPAGTKNIPVGQVIAVLAEEGDDLSKIEVPADVSAHPEEIPKEDVTPKAAEPVKEEQPKESQAVETAAPVHRELDLKTPVFPSVSRLLLGSNLSTADIEKIQPTGIHGMLTKGDVLKALGKVKNAYGSAEKLLTDPLGPSGKRASEAKAAPADAPAAKKAEPPLDGPALRRLIVQGLNKATTRPAPALGSAASSSTKVTDEEFYDLLSDYGSLVPNPAPQAAVPAEAVAPAKKDELEELF